MSDLSTRFVVQHAKGSVIFREGDPGREMFIIHRGKVALYQSIRGEKTLLALLEKGDFFGEMSLLEGLPRTASAEAVEDTDLVRVDGAAFNSMIRENVEIAVRMLRKFSVRLREANQKIARLTAVREPDDLTVDWPMPAAGTMPAASLEISGPEGRIVPVSAAETRIGRHDPVTGVTPEVDLGVEPGGRSVSRRHAQILFRDGRYYLLEEIGTLNHTWHNGRQIETGVLVGLSDGDEIGVGSVRLRFHLG